MKNKTTGEILQQGEELMSEKVRSEEHNRYKVALFRGLIEEELLKLAAEGR